MTRQQRYDWRFSARHAVPRRNVDEFMHTPWFVLTPSIKNEDGQCVGLTFMSHALNNLSVTEEIGSSQMRSH